MCDVVRRIGGAREIPAQQFVSALSAGLDALQSLLDREIDRLVVTGLEMQKRHVGRASPVAAVERLIIEEVERAADIAPMKLRHHEKDLLAHALAHAAEELAGEVGRVPFLISR